MSSVSLSKIESIPVLSHGGKKTDIEYIYVWQSHKELNFIKLFSLDILINCAEMHEGT